MENQCMGCQAGWPIVEVKMFNRVMHEVVDGYPNEKVVCTKKKYEKPDNKEE